MSPEAMSRIMSHSAFPRVNPRKTRLPPPPFSNPTRAFLYPIS